MDRDIIKIEDLIKQNDHNDYNVICFKDQEEELRNYFPSEKIHALPEISGEPNNEVFIIPTNNVKPIRFVCEENMEHMM